MNNWLNLFGIEYQQIHASGHAAAPYLKEMIAKINAPYLFQVHTQRPELFKGLAKNVMITEEAKEYKIE